ncbi:MAG: response regulator [Reichenbachiella sp.]|uniref:response regulator n=1 Tax=Reichenbachiella sp. TaxID=2184521 RepID=UPI0032675A07
MKRIKSIYVVEDDPISSYVIKLALQQHPSFEDSLEFKNGKEAVDYLAQHAIKGQAPGLILLDINMPVLDGWGFLDNFSGLQIKADIPVVMLTSSINPEDIAKAKSHELVKGYLSKPLNKAKLDEILTFL